MVKKYFNLVQVISFVHLFFFCTYVFGQNDLELQNQSKEFLIVDSHIHNGFTSINGKIDLFNFEYFTQRNVDAFIYPLPVDRSKTENLYIRIKEEAAQLRLLAEETKKFDIIDHLDTNYKNNDGGRVNLILSLEYFDGIFDNNVENVKKYSELGIKYITIINIESEKLFDGNVLSAFGKKLITSMNTAGMVIDITHLNEDRKLSVINFSDSPVIASHSNTRKYAGKDYNLSDKVLEALKQNNGYVFVSFNKNDLFMNNDSNINGIDQFINHISYLADKLGCDHVGIGSDYQENGKYVPQQLNEIGTYAMIKEKLFERGFTEDNIIRIMGDNVLNALNIR